MTNPAQARDLPSPEATAAAERPPGAVGASQRRRLRSGLVSAGVLSILLGGLLLAIPGLGAVGHRVAHADWGWVMAGAGLELASCVGYVLAFQGIFNDIPVRFAALVARRPSSRTGDGASLTSRGLGAIAEASAGTLRAIQRPGWRLAIGVVAFLLCDIAVLWLAIHALGYDVPVAPLLLAYHIGYLANSVPIPGGLGVLDGGLAAALILYHVPGPAAVAGVLLYHALALWIPAVSGTIGFMVAQRQIDSGRVRVDTPRATDGMILSRLGESEPHRRIRRSCQCPGLAAMSFDRPLGHQS